MHIANPIYDVVFKYLMEDSKVAKLLVGKIIGTEVVELLPEPQETVFSPDTLHSFTVYRLDYSATIKTPEGERKVIIEIQKAKHASDIMLFRRYLGQQYSNKDNFSVVDGKKIALPIISIYLLGYSLPGIHAPVLHVNRRYIDLATQEICDIKDEFIESLTHDSYLIQIMRLKAQRRNDLEILLGVFDQDNRTSDEHILNVREDEFPEKYRPLIRRLQNAAESEEVRMIMDAEDEILEELAELERTIGLKDKLIEEKDQDLLDKDRIY